jgi:hypothetical protein
MKIDMSVVLSDARAFDVVSPKWVTSGVSPLIRALSDIEVQTAGVREPLSAQQKTPASPCAPLPNLGRRGDAHACT